MKVYVAFKSVPDYHGPPPVFVSMHETFEGARKALYPDKDWKFSRSTYAPDTWNGPDGFGMIRLMEVLP